MKIKWLQYWGVNLPLQIFVPLYVLTLRRWLKEGVSNMAIVDVKLVSGFTVNEELLKKVKHSHEKHQSASTENT